MKPFSITVIEADGTRGTPFLASSIHIDKDRFTVSGYPIYHGGPVGWDRNPDGSWNFPATSDRHRIIGIEITPQDEPLPECYDDGKTLVAGVLYDKETGEEAEPIEDLDEGERA